MRGFLRPIITLLILFALTSAFPASVCQGADQPYFEEVRLGANTAKYQGKMRETALDVLALIPGIWKDIESRLGLNSDFPVMVVIFRDTESFVRVTGNSMIAAFARPNENMVVLNYPAVSAHPLDLTSVLTHELCHLILHRHIPGRNLPKWFDEGVSEWASGGFTELLHPATGKVLRKAVLGKWLIPLDLLRERFPADETGLRLAYEESSDFVTFIVNRHGEDSLRRVLARLANGTEFTGAMEGELLSSPSELEAEWVEELERRPEWLLVLADNIYVIAFLLGAAATVAGFLRLRYRMKNYEDEEEEETGEKDRGTNKSD